MNAHEQAAQILDDAFGDVLDVALSVPADEIVDDLGARLQEAAAR